MTRTIRVLIADDHVEFAGGLEALLRTADDVEPIGVARDGTEAIDLARRLQPDVVLMDLHMPLRNGIEATREIVAASPHIRVVVLTMFDDDESLIAALRAGARGYLLKGSGRDEITRAIYSVASGSLVVGPTLAAGVLNSLNPVTKTRSFPELSEREGEILELIATGTNNTAISERLFLSPKTVRNHITNIFAKLGVNDRAQAIVLFQQRNSSARRSAETR